MIHLTRLNETDFVLNCELIETVQGNPDTTIRLTTGNLYIVKETVEDVIEKTVAFKRSLFTGLFSAPPGRDEE